MSSTERAGTHGAGTTGSVVGVDLGGTKIAAGLVGSDGRIARDVSIRTPARQGPGAVLSAVASAVAELAGDDVLAVGVGSAGAVDARTGTVLSATDALPGWAGTRLTTELHQRTGLPVAVDNDVRAHALGEAWQGSAAGRSPVLFVAVGTGVGAALLVDGEAQRGARSVAGHAGHLPVPAAAGMACTCGAGSGHVEAVAAGPALLATYHRRGGDPGIDQVAELSALAESGDALAVTVLTEGARALGQAVGGLVNMLDPELVLFGGGVSNCGTTWWDALRAGCDSELLPGLAGVRLEPGTLGGSAAVLGAARLAFAALGDQPGRTGAADPAGAA